MSETEPSTSLLEAMAERIFASGILEELANDAYVDEGNLSRRDAMQTALEVARIALGEQSA